MKKLVRRARARLDRSPLARLVPFAKRRFPIPPVGRVEPGDFERPAPFSRVFGYDRGGPVDRVYIERFLEANRDRIRGRVLEIGDDEYTRRFGGERVTKAEILHVDASNERATYVGDLADAPQIPSDAFDCIVLTQVLQLVWDVPAALRTCFRILKPGGTLLCTVPGITQVDAHEWGANWYWSFTDRAMRRLATEAFPGGDVDVRVFGNVYTSAAFLYGMGAGEVQRDLLEKHDPCYQLVITVAAQKA